MSEKHDNDFDLALAVGELKGMMTGVIERLDRQNGSIAEVAKKVQRHDIVFGKIGVAVTALVFVFNVAVNFLVDWGKELFAKQ